METFWYGVVTFMLGMYAVLDGFDFGVGIVHVFVARTDAERRQTLAAIGPVWSGNEVWLIAGGGTLFLAFPKAYASGFSGFYLALMIVLWLLIGRGLALELRTHFEHPLWRQWWDAVFAVMSGALALLFGVALGNVIRGVPLDADGYFFVTLWTDFLPGMIPGLFDWFTLLVGATSVALLTWHGSNYVAMKTLGAVQGRARRMARVSGLFALALLVVMPAAIAAVQPAFREQYSGHTIGYLWPASGLLAVIGALWWGRRRRDTAMFGASSVAIFALPAATAWGMYPHLLMATTDPAYSLTIANASAGDYGLRAAAWWFTAGITGVMAYQLWVHRLFRGPIQPDSDS